MSFRPTRTFIHSKTLNFCVDWKTLGSVLTPIPRGRRFVIDNGEINKLKRSLASVRRLSRDTNRLWARPPCLWQGTRRRSRTMRKPSSCLAFFSHNSKSRVDFFFLEKKKTFVFHYTSRNKRATYLRSRRAIFVFHTMQRQGRQKSFSAIISEQQT